MPENTIECKVFGRYIYLYNLCKKTEQVLTPVYNRCNLSLKS